MELTLLLIVTPIAVIQLIAIVVLLVRKPGGGEGLGIGDVEKIQNRSERLIREDLKSLQRDSFAQAKEGRQELSQSLNSFGNSLLKRMHESTMSQSKQLELFAKQLAEMTKQNDTRLESIRGTVEKQIVSLQKDNSEKLEKMREVVDEKLQSTLEKRLTASFKTVSERLEQVHKGLGEMQNLATGVGDLKKVLANVKTRGTWGEVQLGNLLEQILTPNQYETNVATKKGANGRVEFAIKLPGKDADLEHIWLPIDAKFPIEDYQRLIEAEEIVDKVAMAEARKALEKRLKDQAKTIRSLYVDPPNTTDFAVMFLPVEGLYAEVLKMPGFVEMIQREYRVIITGPTTITAILNSLQMGFRTLAIEKQSSQIWKTLAEVKTEFGRFGDILEKTQKKLQEASNHIDQGSVRARAIERKLRKVEALPEGDSKPQNFLE